MTVYRENGRMLKTFKTHMYFKMPDFKTAPASLPVYQHLTKQS